MEVVKSLLIFQTFSLSVNPVVSVGFLASLFEAEEEGQLEDGLDPAEYFRLKRREELKNRPPSQRRRRKRKRYRNDLLASESKSSSSSGAMRTQFLVPESYKTPPPECNGK